MELTISTMIASILLLSLASTSHGLGIGMGACPEMPTIEDFDMNKFLGDWYEFERSNAAWELGVKCLKLTLSWNDEKNIKMHYQGKRVMNVPTEYQVEGKRTGIENVLAVKFLNSDYHVNYTIVDTDYDSYALAVTCADLNGFMNGKNAWILTREPLTLANEIRAKFVEILDSYGFNVAKLNKNTDGSC